MYIQFGRSKLIIMLWLLVVGAIYLFYVTTASVAPEGASQLAVVPPHWKPAYINAITLIAASSMASDKIVDYTLASIRKYGNWKGRIFILTDRPSCFDKTATEYSVEIIQIPKPESIIRIKSFKPKIMSYLPTDITGALYIDVDVLVTKDLSEFLYDAERLIQAEGNNFDHAMFLDAAGHYIGFCGGCEKWHTGVMVLRRGMGLTCLSEWESILLSGKFITDQESIDEAENNGKCPGSVALPSKHLMFAKDYLAIMLTSSRTFLHLTGAGRLGEQDFFYRLFAVPHFRNSLSKLDHRKFDGQKICSP